MTGEISVHYAADPSYPPPSAAPSTAWKYKTYHLASIPLRKPRSVIDNASEFISTAIAAPFSFFSGHNAVPQATPEEVFSSDIDLKEDEVLEEERGEEAEVDDSPELGRKVRVLASDEKSLGAKARDRRRWQVAALRTTDARTGA